MLHQYVWIAPFSALWQYRWWIYMFKRYFKGTGWRHDFKIMSKTALYLLKLPGCDQCYIDYISIKTLCLPSHLPLPCYTVDIPHFHVVKKSSFQDLESHLPLHTLGFCVWNFKWNSSYLLLRYFLFVFFPKLLEFCLFPFLSQVSTQYKVRASEGSLGSGYFCLFEGTNYVFILLGIYCTYSIGVSSGPEP